MIRIANAPVSYGVFELSLPDAVPLPSGDELARHVRDGGYDGIDLGPSGLLGHGPDLAARLRRFELALAGGWIDLPFSAGDEEFAAALAGLGGILDDFVAASEVFPDSPPKPTIADSGSAERKAHPGGAPELELDGDRWHRFAERIRTVHGLVAERGLEPTFHHHACTYVETPREIERLLTDTDMGLTFDTGHLLIGGGDPVADFDRWFDRINHLHIKDADTSVLGAAVGAEDPMRAVWEQRVFVPLGEGDLDVDTILDRVLERGYDGWIVVEQDVLLKDASDVDRAVSDQVRNRERLRRWFP